MNAGTNITPPESGTLSANACTSVLARMACRPSRSHCTTAPPMNTLPSMAYCGVVSVCAAAVVMSPACETRNSLPAFISMKQPVP